MARKKKAKPIETNAPAVVRRWRKFFGLSCSHAAHVHRGAWEAALAFKRDLAPDFTFHLGDFCDTTAFRRGRSGNEPRDPVEPDLVTGLCHLEQLEPNLVLCGNHEDRLWAHRESRNETVAFAAQQAVQMIHNEADRLHAELVPYDGVWGGRMMGSAFLTHGTIYNVNAARDMAEMYSGLPNLGHVIFGHTHTVATGTSRNAARVTGWNIGALIDPGQMDYAKCRRQSMAWQNAWVSGEFSDNDCRPVITRFSPPETKLSIPHARHAHAHETN